MKKRFGMLVVACALLLWGLPQAANAAPFTVSITGFADNAILTTDMAYDKSDAGGHPCGGVNEAPGLSWANPPERTASYAIIIVDPGGAGGSGVYHLVTYNIPASATGISAADVAAAKYTPGHITGGLIGYRGPCPGVGDAPHHYDVILFALDTLPQFPPDLDRDGLLAAMKGHVLGATTTSFRFQRT